MLTAAAAGGLVAAAALSTARAQSARKTFLLIPGAFCGAWCWRRVSDRLEKQGHKVYSLTLTGLGDRSHLLSKDVNLDTHIADIVNLVEWEDLSGICLVAHSYGGFPASGALERIGNRVSSVVMVDALKPDDGQSVLATPPQDGAIGRPPPKAVAPNAFHDPKDASWFLSKMTPHPVGTFLQPVKLSGARERLAKKTYIRLPIFQSAAMDKAYAETKDDKSWAVFENTTSGHMVMINEADWLTPILLQAA